MAATKKRALEEGPSNPKAKKKKSGDSISSSKPKVQAEKPLVSTSSLLQEEVDFPRGGGTSFTPVEVKAIRAEAVKEANEELFENAEKPKAPKRKRKSEVKEDGAKKAKGEKSDAARIEHLNYKRVTEGMRILGQVVSIEPLALIVSLPNQLFGYVPITEVSSQFTAALEAIDEREDSPPSDDEEEDGLSRPRLPDMLEMFRVGQYVRTVVTTVHPQGATDHSGLGRPKDDMQKASRRLELSLVPEKVNSDVVKGDLKSGFTLSAAIKSVEDHGYILDFGIPDVSGFLSFKDAKKGTFEHPEKLPVGHLLDVSATKIASNGRTCNVTVDPQTFATSSISEATNVGSVLPGMLVQSLITAVQPDGVNLQVLGFFDGTVDQAHLLFGSTTDNYKVGKKVKARVLYPISQSSPPKFALSLAEHVLKFADKTTGSERQSRLQDAYSIGAHLEAIKVTRVEPERGIYVEVSPGVEGFVHISHVSDEHVPALSPSSGAWQIGSVHQARVTGFFPFDGILQLSLRPSILSQKFVQAGEIRVGEVIKGTVKKLTDSALFVSISGNVDGVIWPNHFADIQLKHPQKRFRVGGSIKCRVLVVDPERKRIVLTAKKTLVESTLPIVAQPEDLKPGLITHAVVVKVSEKSLLVEFYSNIKAIVPAREASETAIGPLPSAFPIGKPVQVRVISVDPENNRVVASIRQAVQDPTLAALELVQIGDTVEGAVSEIHKENVLVILQPTQVKALISLKNLAKRQGKSVPQLRASLKVGTKLLELLVVARNLEKGVVIVAAGPSKSAEGGQNAPINLDTVEIGQSVSGRVMRHGRQGTLVKLTHAVTGTLHPADVADDYEGSNPFPAIDSRISAVVVGIHKEKRQLALSTRPSRMHPGQVGQLVDPEITNIDTLKVGQSIRGFIKQIADHGLFVTLGRNVDARVQIKELFDDFVKDWKSRFSPNQLVKGRVLSLNIDKKQVELTFRSGDLKRDSRPVLTLRDLSKGQKIEGRVKKVEDFGIFIEIDGSKVTGLCHKSEISDNKDADVTLALRGFREGDRVKAVVLNVDEEKRRVSFGLKPSYFSEEDLASDKASDDFDEDDHVFGVIEETDEGDASGNEGQSGDEENEGDDGDDDGDDSDAVSSDTGVDEDHMDIDMHVQTVVPEPRESQPSSTSQAGPSLSLKNGFQWSANPQQDSEPLSESSSDEDETGDTKRKKKKRKAIEQDLTADMHTKLPDSNTDFERVLLGSPNSSYLWIQYMSFQLQLSEVEKAREIARRALKTINFREEQEKLNVWTALLNLENIYGTDESLETTFKDAARHNDSKTVHLRLAAILEQSEKFEKAEEQHQRTCKKFGTSSKVWTLFGEFYLKRGKMEEARNLMPRSLQSLEKRKHLKTISKFAQLEYKFGDPERGKTIFEGIVDSHPKRWDLWSIYMDMEAGQGDIGSLRNLFTRVLAQKMTSHKAKSFFKKWLELERILGDEEGQEAVKAKAIEWTQRNSS